MAWVYWRLFNLYKYWTVIQRRILFLASTWLKNRKAFNKNRKIDIDFTHHFSYFDSIHHLIMNASIEGDTGNCNFIVVNRSVFSFSLFYENIFRTNFNGTNACYLTNDILIWIKTFSNDISIWLDMRYMPFSQWYIDE